jgi:hypothetical protein
MIVVSWSRFLPTPADGVGGSAHQGGSERPHTLVRRAAAASGRWQARYAEGVRQRGQPEGETFRNVPFPRKQPDLLMAESPPKGGLSALTGARPALWCDSGHDVGQRRREPLARLLEFALDV